MEHVTQPGGDQDRNVRCEAVAMSDSCRSSRAQFSLPTWRSFGQTTTMRCIDFRVLEYVRECDYTVQWNPWIAARAVKIQSEQSAQPPQKK
jgi:hypothetical protein